MCFIKKHNKKLSIFLSLFFFAFLQYLIFVWCCCSGVGICQLKKQCNFVHIIMQLENLTLLCKKQFWQQAWTLSSLHFGPTLLLPSPTTQRTTNKNIRVSTSNAKIALWVIYMRMKMWSLKRVHEKPSIENVLMNVFYLSFLTRFFFLTNPNEITLSKKNWKLKNNNKLEL